MPAERTDLISHAKRGRSTPRLVGLIALLMGVGLVSVLSAQTQPDRSGNDTAQPTAPDASPSPQGDPERATNQPQPDAGRSNQSGQRRAPTDGEANNAGPETNRSAAGGLDPQTGEFPTLWRLFQFSPVINTILAALSALAVMLFLFFMLTINSRAMVPADLVDELNKLVLASKYEEAADLCRRHRRVFISSIIQRCAENSARGHNVIMEMVDTEGRRRADIVWNRISYLADISNVAPMLGLLGTVLGMIRAFFLLEISQRTGGQISQTLSQGIGQAMATTMFGLVVGITALVLYSIVKSRVTRTLAEGEAAVHSIVDKMQGETRHETRVPDSRSAEHGSVSKV